MSWQNGRFLPTHPVMLGQISLDPPTPA